jgi:glycosyltransferase involved in cell wall biosynthesis
MASEVRVGTVLGSELAPNEESVMRSLLTLLAPEVTLEVVVNHSCSTAGFEEASIFRGDPASTPADDSSSEYKETLATTRRYVRTSRPDFLFHLTKPHVYGLAIATVGKAEGVRTVVRVPGEALYWHKRLSLPGRTVSYLTTYRPALRAFRQADAVVSVSRHLVDMLVEHDVPREKVRVIREPLDRERFAPAEDKGAVRDRLGLPLDRRLVITVGRLDKVEDVGFFPELVDAVSSGADDILFVHVGRGSDYQPRVERDCGDHVRFVGEVPHTQVHEYYQASDLMMHLTRTEGFPNTVTEAEACGVPVVASPVGDMAEFVPTFDTAEGFAEFIIGGEWPPVELPEEFDNGVIRERYLELFLG